MTVGTLATRMRMQCKTPTNSHQTLYETYEQRLKRHMLHELVIVLNISESLREKARKRNMSRDTIINQASKIGGSQSLFNRAVLANSLETRFRNAAKLLIEDRELADDVMTAFIDRVVTRKYGTNDDDWYKRTSYSAMYIGVGIALEEQAPQIEEKAYASSSFPNVVAPTGLYSPDERDQLVAMARA
jgi:hypothetical protein